MNDPAGDVIETAILWRRVDEKGHESACIFAADDAWHLRGSGVFEHENQPCRLDYEVACDSEWRTTAAFVRGWIGRQPIDLRITCDEGQDWRLNSVAHPALAGCIDVDLNFSPSTNLLPIRRLDLAVGDSAEVRAAWLRFPSLTLEVLEQRYSRLGPTAYRYESIASGFACNLEVNEFGLVTHYPGFFVTAARE